MSKYLLLAIIYLLSVAEGVNLHIQIVEGEFWNTALASLPILITAVALFFTCRVWYHTGAINAYKEMREIWEKKPELPK